MQKNNIRAAFALLLATFLIVRTAHAEIEVSGVHAELSATEPRRVEIYFVLHNATGHELELLKAVCGAGDVVALKQRSYGAEGQPRLWPVAKLEVQPGDSVRLRADGRFFQVSEVPATVRVGQTLPFILYFEDEKPFELQLTLEAAQKR